MILIALKGWKKIKTSDGTRYEKPSDSDSGSGSGLGIAAGNSIPLNTGKGFFNLRQVFRRWFTSRGDFPQDVFDANVDREGRISKHLKDIAFTERDWKRALAEAYGRTTLTEKETDDIDRVLRGEKYEGDLPPAVRPVVMRMREQIDLLSQALMDSGAVEGDIVGTIDANMGRYLHRSYQVFNDDQWSRKVPVEVRNRAKSWLRSFNEDASEAEIERLIDELLYKGKAAEARDVGTPISALAKAKLGSKDLSILFHRRDLPAELRELWGELTDPLANYAASVHKMAHLLANHLFQVEVRQKGLGKFLSEQFTNELPAEISPKGSPGMGKLAGLHTTPEIAKAFKDYFKKSDPPAWLQKLYWLTATTKVAKTVGNASTHARNFLANSGLALMHGHWRFDKLKIAGKSTAAELWGGEGKARDYVRRLTQLGVLGQGVDVGQFNDLMERAYASKDPLKFLHDKMQPWWVKAPKWLTETVGAVYQAEDAFWKVYFFENERARYRAALPKLSDAEIDKIAAEIVNDTTPTYSRASALIKAWSRFPLMGSFIVFNAEIMRNTGNTFALIAKELADPRLRHIGAQRVAGFAAALTLLDAAALTAMALLGSDKKNLDAARRMAAPWDKFGTLVKWEDGEGNFTYVNLSYTDPLGQYKKAFWAFMSGDNWKESWMQAGWQTIEPFASEDVFAGKILDVLRNRKADDRRVYNPQASETEIVEKSFAHIFSALRPGTLDWVGRVLKATGGKESETGRKYDLNTELLAGFVGQRMVPIDPKQSLFFKTKDYEAAMMDARRLLSTVINRRGTVTEKEVIEAYRSSERARAVLFEKMHKDIIAAQKLGRMTEDQVVELIRSAGISEENAKLLLAGDHKKIVPNDRGIDRIPSAERKKLVQSIVEREAFVDSPTLREDYIFDLANDLAKPKPLPPQRRSYPSSQAWDAARTEFPNKVEAWEKRQKDALEALRRLEVPLSEAHAIFLERKRAEGVSPARRPEVARQAARIARMRSQSRWR
ncbi:MAG: hypothetical protein AB7K24_13115 [Gemmataceae bacterium]